MSQEQPDPEAGADQYAQLASAAYTGHPVENWNIDSELSSPDRTVFHKDGKAVIAYRGTQLGSKHKWRDIGTDALLAMGLQDLSSRFRHAKQAADKTIQKYGKENTVAVGHSLGGSQSLYVHSKRGIDSHSYNPGISPVDVVRSNGKLTGKHALGLIDQRKVGGNAHIYYTAKDPISGFSRYLSGGTKHLVQQTHKSAHSLKNFFRRK